MRIGIVGGTGPLGRGLGLRWARAGHTIYAGSRSLARSCQAVADLSERLAAAGGGPGALHAATNQEACRACEVAVLAVPAPAGDDLVGELAPALRGKVLVDCTVRLDPADPTRVPPGHAATAVETQRVAGPEVKVVAAFHTVAAAKLMDLTRDLATDTFVAGDDPEAKGVVLRLAEEIGLRAFDAGPLEVAGTLERITAMLIGLNKRYKRRGIGIRLSGV